MSQLEEVSLLVTDSPLNKEEGVTQIFATHSIYNEVTVEPIMQFFEGSKIYSETNSLSRGTVRCERKLGKT